MSKRTYLISLVILCGVLIGTLFIAHRATTPAIEATPNSEFVSTSTTPDGLTVNQAPLPTNGAVPSPNVAAPSSTAPQTVPSAAAATPTSYTVPVYSHETVLAAMQAYASSTTSFTFSGENYSGLGFFVDSIGGKANANGLYWFLYINGTSSSLGASSAEVNAGDVVEWRYEKSD